MDGVLGNLLVPGGHRWWPIVCRSEIFYRNNNIVLHERVVLKKFGRKYRCMDAGHNGEFGGNGSRESRKNEGKKKIPKGLIVLSGKSGRLMDGGGDLPDPGSPSLVDTSNVTAVTRREVYRNHPPLNGDGRPRIDYRVPVRAAEHGPPKPEAHPGRRITIIMDRYRWDYCCLSRVGHPSSRSTINGR